jgi:hypothetical protein
MSSKGKKENREHPGIADVLEKEARKKKQTTEEDQRDLESGDNPDEREKMSGG